MGVRPSPEQTKTTGQHHIAVRGQKTPLPLEHGAPGPQDEGGCITARLFAEWPEGRAVPTAGLHLFRRQPAQPELLQILQQLLQIAHAGVMLINAAHFSLID